MGLRPAKNIGRGRATFGSQIQRAAAMRPLSSATVITSRSASPRAWTGRSTYRSTSSPKPGASTSSTTARATGTGQPQPTVSCQYMNADSMPAAPCAKLNTPVVV